MGILEKDVGMEEWVNGEGHHQTIYQLTSATALKLTTAVRDCGQ